MLSVMLFGAQTAINFTGRIKSLVMATNAHGDATLTATIPMSFEEAYLLYRREDVMTAVVSWNGLVVWKGRVEDKKIINGGITLMALGQWRALSDVPYTALWSDTKVADWKVLPEDLNSDYDPQQYVIDTNNRLYIGLKKNAVYPDISHIGSLYLLTPDRGDRQMVTISFDYDYNLPTNWIGWCRMLAADWSPVWIVWQVTGDGAQHTGSQSINFSAHPADIVQFAAINNTGSNYTMSGEDGASYLKITNLRVQTTTSAALYADEIAAALAVFVNGVNAGQISASTALIESPGVDLSDVLYNDALPADILTALVALGDNQTPARLWEVGVYEDDRLFFRPRGSAGRDWAVDVSTLELESTLTTLINSAYGVYADRNNNVLRTVINADADSVAARGLTRRAAVPVKTTSATQAETQRDAVLNNGVAPQPRIGLKFAQIFDRRGAAWPNWMVRSGDTMTIRNIPIGLSEDVDRVRTFLVSETRYTAETDTLEVTPELNLPAIDVLLAQKQQANETPAQNVAAGGNVSAYAGFSTQTGEILFTIDGAVAVAAGKLHFRNGLNRAVRLTKVVLRADTAPTGAAIIADVNINGTSVFASPGDRPQIAAGATSGEAAITQVLQADDDLSVDVDQVGSTVAGSDLVVHVVYAK